MTKKEQKKPSANDRFSFNTSAKNKYRVCMYQSIEDEKCSKKYFQKHEYHRALSLYLQKVTEQTVGLGKYELIALDEVAEHNKRWQPYFESYSTLYNLVGSK